MTDDEGLWQEAAQVQQFGEVRRTDGVREYNAYGMGWMYRTTEMTAAFVRSQLTRLDAITAHIRANAGYLTRHLSGIAGLHTPLEPPDRTHVFFRYVLNESLFWAEEAVRFSMVWSVLLGSALVARDRAHIRIDVVESLLPPLARRSPAGCVASRSQPAKRRRTT